MSVNWINELLSLPGSNCFFGNFTDKNLLAKSVISQLITMKESLQSTKGKQALRSLHVRFVFEQAKK